MKKNTKGQAFSFYYLSSLFLRLICTFIIFNVKFLNLLISMRERKHKKCICELCTCGQHTCFQTITQHQPYQEQMPSCINTYQQLEPRFNYHYHNHEQYARNDPNRRLKTEEHYPSQKIKSKGNSYTPLKGTTTYHDEFNRIYDRKVIDLINPEIKLDKPQYIRPNFKFQGQSRYKSDFIDSPYMQRIRQNNRFNNKKIREKLPLISPFQGTSTYHSSYQPYYFEIKQASSQKKAPPPIKFEGNTSYRQNYKGFTIKQEIEVECPVASLPVPKVNFSTRKHLYYDALTNSFA